MHLLNSKPVFPPRILGASQIEQNLKNFEVKFQTLCVMYMICCQLPSSSPLLSYSIPPYSLVIVYYSSSLVRKVLCDAQAAGKNFRVIVVDSRPKLEGKEQVRRLIKHGIKCSYVLMNAVSYMMQEVSVMYSLLYSKLKVLDQIKKNHPPTPVSNHTLGQHYVQTIYQGWSNIILYGQPTLAQHSPATHCFNVGPRFM